MQRTTRSILTVLLLSAPGTAQAAQPPDTAEPAVAATVETTLRTASGRIRQFAFDGDPESFFVSDENATRKDHFTLVLDEPVAVTSVMVTTGRPDGSDRLEEGILEGSADGETFEPLAQFAGGTAGSEPQGRQLKAIRVRPGADLTHPLVVREIVIDSQPAVAVFRYPVEIVVDVSDAPEMQEWAEEAARVCERQYAMICEELMSDGFRPRTVIRMTLRNDYRGVAAASGGRIIGSVSYFKNRPDDIGAMVHETVHCVQAYRSRNNPGWLVEGVADYIRFFKYEPENLGRISPRRARYNGSYRVSAAFLAWVTDNYNEHLVRELNAAMRNGTYDESIWTTLTERTVQQLDEEWRASLQAD